MRLKIAGTRQRGFRLWSVHEGWCVGWWTWLRLLWGCVFMRLIFYLLVCHGWPTRYLTASTHTHTNMHNLNLNWDVWPLQLTQIRRYVHKHRKHMERHADYNSFSFPERQTLQPHQHLCIIPKRFTITQRSHLHIHLQIMTQFTHSEFRLLNKMADSKVNYIVNLEWVRHSLSLVATLLPFSHTSSSFSIERQSHQQISRTTDNFLFDIWVLLFMHVNSPDSKKTDTHSEKTIYLMFMCNRFVQAIEL